MSLFVAVFVTLTIPRCLTRIWVEKGTFGKRPGAAPIASKRISGTEYLAGVGGARIGHICVEGCGDPTHVSTCFITYCERGYVCGFPPDYPCCPADLPEYFTNLCCPTGTYFECKKKVCCTSERVCCKDVDNCCEKEEQCCNSEECCDSKSPCCRGKNKGEGTCCTKEKMVCCDGQCGPPCPSQFDIVPCDEESDKDTATQRKEKMDERQVEKLVAREIDPVVCSNWSQTGVLYRPLCPDESCDGEGLSAKDPTATKLVLSHINCGSKLFTNYESQYISFSTSLDVLTNNYLNPGGRIAKVRADKIPYDCIVYDLTQHKERARLLGKAVTANKYAAANCVVLLQCKFAKSYVPCEIIKIYDRDRQEL